MNLFIVKIHKYEPNNRFRVFSTQKAALRYAWNSLDERCQKAAKDAFRKVAEFPLHVKVGLWFRIKDAASLYYDIEIAYTQLDFVGFQEPTEYGEIEL